jgi:tetratricopeptide (TPR) repeat protein
MRRRLLSLSVVLSSAAAWAAPAQSQQPQAELLGAGQVIAEGETLERSEIARPGYEEAQALYDRIGEFARDRAGMTPREAAATWLGLLEAAMLKNPDPHSFEQQFWAAQARQLIYEAMPGPDDWEELSRQIDARPMPETAKGILDSYAMRMLGHTLVGDQAARQADAQAIYTLLRPKGAAPDEKLQFGFENNPLGSHEEQAWRLVWMGSQGKSAKDLADLYLEMNKAGHSMPVNLQQVFGEEQTKEILERLVATAAASPGSLYLLPGRDEVDRQLLNAEVLKQLDQFTQPPWPLVESAEDRALYEAIANKFPSDRSPERTTANQAYLAALIRGGDLDRAVELYLASLPQDMQNISVDLQDSSHVVYLPGSVAGAEPEFHRRVVEFYDRVAGTARSDAFWSNYLLAARAAGEVPRFITALKRHTADAPPERQASLDLIMVDALLVTNQVDAALALLEQSIKGVKPAELTAEQLNTVLRMHQIADLSGRKHLAQAQLELIAKAVRQKAPVTDDPRQAGNASHILSDAAQRLDKAGYAAEAERLLVQQLKGVILEDRDAGPSISISRSGELAALLSFYLEHDRTDDAIALLDNAPWWGAKDVVDVWLDADARVDVARALLAAGRPQVAQAIVDDALARGYGNDGIYQLLVELQGPAAIEKLDAQFAKKPFEERPLIWKAKVLLQGGRFEEAETAARQAIAIDPSDGEQGKGSRMIVYAVLADALEKQGGEKRLADAAIYRQAVQAIRLAERADDYRAAGLHAKAIELYEESLRLFSDAYCIQSRLALELAAAGRTDEALVHFRKAFELMPDSFGRIESHCFGCEGIFETPLAQDAAEKVFAKLARERPDNSRVHYLLGYLRDSQDRLSEALAHYRKAVELDPDYVNAWKQIVDISAKLGRGEGDAQLALLRLRGVDGLILNEFSGDLATLWRLIEKERAAAGKKPASIYPLAASAEAVTKSEQAETETGSGIVSLDFDLSFQGRPIGEAIKNLYDDPQSAGRLLFERHPIFVAVAELADPHGGF